jgi:hypothetical protein
MTPPMRPRRAATTVLIPIPSRIFYSDGRCRFSLICL